MPLDETRPPDDRAARYDRWRREEEERERRKREFRAREDATRERRAREVIAEAPKPPGAMQGTVDPAKFGFTRAADQTPRTVAEVDRSAFETPAPVAPDVTGTAVTEGARQGERALRGKYEGAERFEEAAAQAMAEVPKAKARGEYTVARELDRQSESLRALALGTRTLEDDFAIRAYDEATIGLGMFEERQELGRARATVDPEFLAEHGITSQDGLRINLERPMRAQDFAASAVGIIPGMLGGRTIARAGAEFLQEGVEHQGKTYLTSKIAQRIGRGLETAVTSPVTDRAASIGTRSAARAARGATEGAATGAATAFTQTFAETEGDIKAAATAAAADLALGATLGAGLEVAGGAAVDPFRRRLVARTLTKLGARVQSMYDTGFLSPEEVTGFQQKMEWAAKNQRTETVSEELDRLAEKRVTPGGEGPVYRGQYNDLTRERPVEEKPPVTPPDPGVAPQPVLTPIARTAGTLAGAGAVGAAAGAAIAEEGERTEGAVKGAAIGVGVAGAYAAGKGRVAREAQGLRAERDVARRVAETDELTQVGNRRAFMRAKTAAEADPNTAVIRFDLNNFKSLNDALGHEAGDAALKRVAEVLTQQVPGQRAFRPGGDEFSAIVPKADAERILKAVEDAVGVQEAAPNVRWSISGGVGDTDALADVAAMKAKRRAKIEQGLPLMRGGEAAARKVSRTSELESKYGTDEALGVEFREPYPGDEPHSVLPNNRSATICTNCADEIARREPNSVVVGWAEGSNPTAKVNDPEFGHDFAIVDDRYIVDHWAKNTWQSSTRAVYDMQSPTDLPEIKRLYGDPKTWVKAGNVARTPEQVNRALDVARRTLPPAAAAAALATSDDDDTKVGALAATTALVATGDAPRTPTFRSRLRDALTSKKYARLGKLPAGDWITKLKGDNQVSNAEIEKTILPALEAARDRGEKLMPEQVLAFYDVNPLKVNVIALRESADRIALPTGRAQYDPEGHVDLFDATINPDEYEGLDAVAEYRQRYEAAEEAKNDAESEEEREFTRLDEAIDDFANALGALGYDYGRRATQKLNEKIREQTDEFYGRSEERIRELLNDFASEHSSDRQSEIIAELRDENFKIREITNDDTDDPDLVGLYGVYEGKAGNPEDTFATEQDARDWLQEHTEELYRDEAYDQVYNEVDFDEVVNRARYAAEAREAYGNADSEYENFDDYNSELRDSAEAEVRAFLEARAEEQEFVERFGVDMTEENAAFATAVGGGVLDPEQRDIFTGQTEGEQRGIVEPTPARILFRASVAPTPSTIERLRDNVAKLDTYKSPNYSSYQRIGGGFHYRELLFQWPDWGSGKVGHWSGTAPDVVAHARVEEHLVFPEMTRTLFNEEAQRLEMHHEEMRARQAEIVRAIGNATEEQVQASPHLMALLKEYRDTANEMSDVGKQLADFDRENARVQKIEPKVYTTVLELQADPQQRASKEGWKYTRKMTEQERQNIATDIRTLESELEKNRQQTDELFRKLVQKYGASRGVTYTDDEITENVVRAQEWVNGGNNLRQHLLENEASYEERSNVLAVDQDTALVRARIERLKGDAERGVRTEGDANGVLHNPWDEQASTAALGLAAALREAAELDTDGVAWSDASNRVRWAALSPRAAVLTYDQAAPKAMTKLMKSIGFDVKPERLSIRGQSHWAVNLTPEMRAAIKRIGFPMLGALMMLSIPQEEIEAQTGDVVAQPDGSVSFLRALAGLDNADKFVLGASTLTAAVLSTTMKRAGLKAALREVTKGGKLSPLVVGLVGTALQAVPDEDFDDFGKATMALAALKAVGARRFSEAGAGFTRALVKAVSSVPSGKQFVMGISPDLLLPREVRTALDKFYTTKAKGEALKKEVETKAAKLGPEGARKATDILRGEAWEQHRFSAEQLKAVFALASDVVNRTSLLGKEKVNLGVITEAQHAASGGDQYLPRIYGYYEALKATADRRGGQVTSGDAVKIAQDKSRVLDLPVRAAEERLATSLRVYQSAISGGRGQQSNLAPFAKEIIDAKTALDQAKATMDAQRRQLGEVREIGYVAGYNFERGYTQVAAAQLFKVLRDVPGIVPDAYLKAFDQYQAASIAYNDAVDVDARQTARDRTELARLRLKTADKALGALVETRYKTEPSSSHRGRKLMEGYAAERMDAKRERAEGLTDERSSVDSQSRAAARQSMDDARRIMADIARQYRAGNAEYTVLPESMAYGALAGMPVKREVALGLFSGGTGKESSFAARAWLKAMRGWKGTKTTLNPATHAGNTMSNAVMAHMNGLPIHAQPRWLAQALRSLVAYDADARTLAERGSLNITGVFEGSDASRGRGGPSREALLELMRTATPATEKALRAGGLQTTGEEIAAGGYPKLGAFVDAANEAKRKTGGFGVGKVFEGARKLYENEDNVFRVAVYAHAKAKVEDGGLGLSEEDALFNAEKGMIDFRSRSPLLRVLGNTVFPFIRYPIKALPTFARLLIDHPERWLVLTSALLALNEYGEQVAGEELSSEDVPFEKRGSGLSAAAPDLIQVPWGHDKAMGVPAVDFTRMTPISGLTTGAPPGTAAGEAGLPMIANPGGPLLDLAAALRYNIKPGAFNVDEKMIRYEDRGDPVAMSKRVFEAARSVAAPPLLGYYLDEAKEAIRTGDPTRKRNWWLSQIAMRPRYYVPGEQLEREENQLDRAMSDIRYQERLRMRRTAPEGDIDPVFDAFERRTGRARRVFETRTGVPAPAPPRLLPTRR